MHGVFRGTTICNVWSDYEVWGAMGKVRAVKEKILEEGKNQILWCFACQAKKLAFRIGKRESVTSFKKTLLSRCVNDGLGGCNGEELETN